MYKSWKFHQHYFPFHNYAFEGTHEYEYSYASQGSIFQTKFIVYTKQTPPAFLVIVHGTTGFSLLR